MYRGFSNDFKNFQYVTARQVSRANVLRDKVLSIDEV